MRKFDFSHNGNIEKRYFMLVKQEMKNVINADMSVKPVLVMENKTFDKRTLGLGRYLTSSICRTS